MLILGLVKLDPAVLMSLRRVWIEPFAMGLPLP